ncbi:MAG: filamentous hemagglutinin N-terminal domain-containing protein [Vulcanimicrobiota bacterium]
MNGCLQRTLLCALLAGGAAWALPEGGQIIQGGLQIGQPQNNILQILQSTPTGIINWNSFSLDRNQLVQFLQPGSNAALLNRVIGQDPSQILGQIQANGRIVLVNPNGILFGPESSVNAGSFMATTLSLSDQDFLQGRYNLRWDAGTPMRAVVNQGDIRVTEGGFIALVGPLVENQGLLLAERGQVVLGATTQASLTVDARGLLQVSIPDGFAAHSKPAGDPQAVLLTQGQMSDALANLVSHSGSESQRILETPEGIQLLGGEGLLVNQGQVRSEAGQVLMDSSQATLNTRESQVEAGEIRVLSAGSAVQDGLLKGGSIELSGRSVGLHQTPTLLAGGHFLIDPTNVSIVASGGDGTNTINANTLDNGATMTVIADQNLTVANGVQIVLAQPTQLTLQGTAGNVTMGPGSSVNATDDGASLTVIAGATATVGNVAVSSVNVSANSILLTRGQIGTLTGATNFTANSATDFISVQSNDINIEGSTANVTINATNAAYFGAGSNINLNVPLGNLTTTGNTTGLLQGTRVTLAGDGNINLTSNGSDQSVPNDQSGIYLQTGSLLRADGLANITLSAPNALIDLKGGVQATNPASRLDADGGRGVLVRNLAVPTMVLNSTPVGGFVQFLSGNLGVAGADTSILVNSPSISVFTDNVVHVLGSRADVTWQSSNDFGFFTRSQLQLDSPNANLSVTAPNGGSVDDSALIHASGNANITLQGDGSARTTALADQASIVVDGSGRIDLSNTNRDVSLGPSSQLRLGSGNISLTSTNANVVALPNAAILVDGAGNVTASAPAGRVDFRTGSNITASSPGNRIVFSANGDIFVPTLAATDVNITSSNGALNFLAGSLGVAGQNSVINAQGRNINFDSAGPTNLIGNRVTLNLTGHGDLTLNTNQLLRSQANQTDANITVDGQFHFLSGALLSDNGLGNYTVQANVVNLEPGSSISVADPNGRVSLNTTSVLTTASLEASNLSLHAGGDLFYNPGTLGRAGAATTIDAIADSNSVFLAGTLNLAGTSVTLNQTTTAGFTSFVGGADVRLNGNNNQLTFNSNTYAGNPGSRLSGNAPAQVSFRGETVTLDGLTIELPNSASSLVTQSHGVTRLGPVRTGSLSVTTGAFGNQVTAGNVRLIGPWEANNLTINTPADVFDNILNGSGNAVTDRPALIAHQSLTITASHLRGPIQVPEANLVSAIGIGTDGTALVQLNITGSNDPALSNRAGNIYYFFPQTSNLTLNNPNGAVLIYNQPGPTPAPAPPSGPRVISTRADLTPDEFARLTSDAAQPQIQLSNLYSAAYLPSTSSVLMLAYNNIGLTHFAPVPLSTPLLELAVVSPEASISPRAEAAASSNAPSENSSGSPGGATGSGVSRTDTPTVETGVLSPEAAANRNREDAQRNNSRDDQATSLAVAGNDEDEELRYWRRLIEGFIIWEDE